MINAGHKLLKKRGYICYHEDEFYGYKRYLLRNHSEKLFKYLYE